MATIGRKANLWFQSFGYKRSGCPSCLSGEDPSPMLRLCCEHLVDENGESTAPQYWSIRWGCASGLKRNWGTVGSGCDTEDYETVLDSALVTLWKDCVVGCTWSARRKTLGGIPDLDGTDPCCAAEDYASPPAGGGQTESIADGYWATDTIFDNPNCRPWVLEVTGPTSATLTYTYRDGTSVTYVPKTTPWNPLANPQEWVVTPETVANRGVLPCELCVIPGTDPNFGPRPCRKASDTCACCDDYQCTSLGTIRVDCPDEDLLYDTSSTRYQWEDDEGDPNILDCESPFRLPTINPFASFNPLFADFPATYENAPCGVWYGSGGPFLLMFACIGPDTYHLRIVCTDLETDEDVIIFDGEPEYLCTCHGWTFSFEFTDQPCVDCPGGDPVVTECCPGGVSRNLDVEIAAWADGGAFQPGCDACLGSDSYPPPISGTTIPISYNDGLGYWVGSTTVCGATLEVRVECRDLGGGIFDYYIIFYVNGVMITDASLSSGCTFSCSPFNGCTSGVSFFYSLSDCQSIIAVVTESI